MTFRKSLKVTFLVKTAHFTALKLELVSFKGKYDDRVSRMEDRNSIFSSAYWNAEEIVERQMRSEISDLERQIAKKEAELQSREQAERSAKSYHSSSLA